jgi:hypothetical protein
VTGTAYYKGDQIVAVQTLVRELPTPIRKIIGDFSNDDKGSNRIEYQTSRQRAELVL